MSFQQIKGLSKSDLKNKLFQMGMSLDRDDHPRDYYAQLYLEKSNAKNKITRDNTPFYNNKMLTRKRQRESIKETEKELIDDPNYQEEEYEEEEEIIDEDKDIVGEELEEKSEEDEKGINFSKRKNIKKVKIDEKTNDYRESGIKIIRLIRKKKEKKQNNSAKNDIKQSSVRRKILNNFNEMAGQNDEYTNNNTENYLSGENTKNQNINNVQDSNSKINEFYNLRNRTNLPAIKNDVKVEKTNNYGDNQNNNIITFGKENQYSSKPKKIILKWDTPRQKEFLYSSMEKEQTFKKLTNEEMNKLNKVNLQNEFEENMINNQQRGQIVSDSIHNTMINQNFDNDYNSNNNENNIHKVNINEKENESMNNLNDNLNNKDDKEFIINNNQENNNENMNINDNNMTNYSNSDINMDNNNYKKDIEMKVNNDMKNLVNNEEGKNEMNKKDDVSENTEKKKSNKNCNIF